MHTPFHKTILQAFHPVAFRKRIYTTLNEPQAELDNWIRCYNVERTHRGKMCCGCISKATMSAIKELYDAKVTQLNRSGNPAPENRNCQIGARLLQLSSTKTGETFDSAKHRNEFTLCEKAS